jgi:hypothetical protein
MKLTMFLPLPVVAAVAFLPVGSNAQSYDQGGPSITIPVPGFGGQGNRREQQAEVYERHCADLRAREQDLRDRRDFARYPEDRERIDDRLRDVRDQLRDQCR